MLGNWSLGDYWKKEAISWSFEFLTKELKLPIEKLAVSCFAGDKDAPRDEESVAIWMSLGIPEEKIYFLGKKDNWWGPAGNTGPCGPDTEMFFWMGKGEPESLITGDNKSEWVEIWNNVFMQYNKTIEGKFEPLPQRNVDTGMGLERTVSVVNNKDMFLIDTFKPIIEKIEKLSGKKYENELKAMRIIADHIKASTFILGDEKGIAPSNTGQGYVLRRLIRRAVRYGKQLGIESFTGNIALIVIDMYKNVYPELFKNRDFILDNLQQEEEKFEKTLERGLKEFEKIIEIYLNSELDEKVLQNDTVFTLVLWFSNRTVEEAK
jgi:alanyl-tRNA synthetase